MSDNLPPLLPCPFCGGAPKTIERPDNIDGTEFVYAVSCYCDGYSARAHQLARCKTPEQAKAAATSAWNRRAALAQAQSLPDVPEIDYQALINAAYKRDRKWAQGTNGCIAFKHGAEWFRDLIAASPQPQPVQPSDAWLPIDTAPKDGTEIIMSNGKDVSAGSWFKGHDGTYDRDGAPNCDEKDACWIDWSGGMLPEPTHWTPLPSAPQPKD